MSRSMKPLVIFLTTLALFIGLALFAQVSSSTAQGLQLPDALNHVTRTPRPTSTPPAIPPPADPASSNLMILLAVLIVSVILVGIWINRSRAV